MTNEELLAKIKAEINKLYGEYKDKFHQSGDQYHLGLIDGLDMAERVLDTLESERPEPYNPVYDEAYLNEKIKKATESWKGVDVDAMLAECRGYDEEKSEKPMNQDDAMKELDEKIALVKERVTWEGIDVDSYMDEVRGRVIDDLEEAAENIYKTPFGTRAEDFKAGAEWQKEQMMNEAVEGTVMDFSSNQPRPQVDVLLDAHKYHTGDKVRIIIVKED